MFSMSLSISLASSGCTSFIIFTSDVVPSARMTKLTGTSGSKSVRHAAAGYLKFSATYIGSPSSTLPGNTGAMSTCLYMSPGAIVSVGLCADAAVRKKDISMSKGSMYFFIMVLFYCQTTGVYVTNLRI